MNIKKYMSVALAGIIAVSVAGCNIVERTPESIGKTVLAKVDGDKITKDDLDKEMKAVLEQYKSYYGDDLDTYEFNIDGFNGWIGSFKTFEVKDIDGEQFYRLYPISNDGGGAIFNDLKMDGSYDEDEENLDNILITIKIK